MPIHEYLMHARHDDRLQPAARQHTVRQLRDLARQSRRAARTRRRIIRSLKRSRLAVLPA